MALSAAAPGVSVLKVNATLAAAPPLPPPSPKLSVCNSNLFNPPPLGSCPPGGALDAIKGNSYNGCNDGFPGAARLARLAASCSVLVSSEHAMIDTNPTRS